MAEVDNDTYHIGKILMRNWVLFQGAWTLDFEELMKTEDKVFAFIGPSNTGKSTVLSGIDTAVRFLECFLDQSDVLNLGSSLDEHNSPSINKHAKMEESLFAVKMTGNSQHCYFGLFSPRERDAWKRTSDEEPFPSVCFLVHNSQLFLQRQTDDQKFKLKINPLTESLDNMDNLIEILEKYNVWDATSDTPADPSQFNRLVRRILPCCVVSEDCIKAIYSGQYAGNNIPGMRRVGTENICDSTTEQEFRQHELPSGLKFQSYAAYVVDRMMDHNPPKRCLIFEEPTRCMHPAMIREFMWHIGEMCRERCLQLVMSTHSPTAVESLPLTHVFLFSRFHDSRAEVRPAVEEAASISYFSKSLHQCLFARVCIFVDGPGVQRLLEKALFVKLRGTKPGDESKFTRFLRDAIVVNVESKHQMRNLAQSLVRLSIPHVFICNGVDIFGTGEGEERFSLENDRSRDDLLAGFRRSEIFKPDGLIDSMRMVRDEHTGPLRSRDTPPTDFSEDITSADDVFRIAEKHRIHCLSREGTCDLQALIGPNHTDEDVAFRHRDREISRIVGELERDGKFKAFFDFLKTNADELISESPPRSDFTAESVTSPL